MNAAILLAAGASTRMGRPKQLLDWGGQPLVAAQAEALLEAGCGPVIVVLGAHERLVREAVPDHPGVRCVVNRAWREGRAGSIRAGARAVPAGVEGVVAASVDSPCAPGVIRACGAALEADAGAWIAVPRCEGQNGHPPVFARRLLAELQSVTERGEGLRALRRRYAERTIFVDTAERLCLLNLNTPERYQEALAISRLVDGDRLGEASPGR